ncbi:MAG: MaoC family dehydratase [Flavobacteriales bacterium]|nr:MAG: MaoC family dehydratase [Flavobacteriales bacterium]|tara:strand:- start:1010 stop:1495 length:486 start_codon:yes stop_codon:yes gene_type:complete
MGNSEKKAYSTKFKELTELKNFIGKELGLTKWMQMSQQKIDDFAKITDDQQWIHTDPKKSALYSPYKKTIAHGFLVLSMITRLSFDAFSIENIAAGINYGLDRVRFPNATKSDSTYRGKVSLIEFTEIPGGAKYKLKVEIEIKGEDKPACIAEFLALAYTK